MTSSVAGQKTPRVELSPKAVATAASRRSKRDAPGTVMQSSQDGGAAVSVSKRKTKPAKPQKITLKSAALAADTLPQIRIDVDGRQEIVDPDEERYCLCGDVSWGEMICCELDEKVRSFCFLSSIVFKSDASGACTNSVSSSATTGNGSTWNASHWRSYRPEQ